ncbi:hypothetical protein EJB05_03743 [Eragrostis curvula]|uniref:Uncharacterized protein n=1 Tax=Eragrostis curvula TaxID=38414 RepID=A0A5J9W8P5_9POAL|nr:hypothetical protein EJB05_03743 [Eragrostis curvula]
MGSLMSGWSSPVLGDKKVRMMRNRSLTKEEVDAFWRQRGRPDDNAQGSPLGSPRIVSDAVVSPLPSSRRSELQQDQSPFEARRLDAVRSLPSPLARGAGSLSSSSHAGRHVFARSEPSSPAARAEGFPDNAATDSPSTSCDWWTRSSWAFLNEPHQQQQEEVSVSSGSAHKHKGYALDQFSVTRIVTGNA